MGNLNLTTMIENQDDKEVTSNDADNELDLAITDNFNIVVDATDAVTLTDAQWRGAMMFLITDDASAPDATMTITVPAIKRGVTIFRNDTATAFDAIITISAQAATPYRIAPGGSSAFINDGTNILPIGLGRGRIPLDITSLREIVANDIDVDANHGGILTSNSTPALLRLNAATDKALRVNWVAGNVDEVQFPTVPMFEEIDETQDMTVHLLARMDGATDTPTIDVQVFDAIGDTEMGGATAALSATLAELTVTIANANISGHPLGFLNISLIPGAHATDEIELLAAWIEYEKKIV